MGSGLRKAEPSGKSDTIRAGVPVELGDGLRCLLAPNPSSFTGGGTNTYLLGMADIAVIDPGPDIDQHLDAIVAATDKGRLISHILVTHAHVDHSSLANRLAHETGAPIHAFGRFDAGRSPHMQALDAEARIGGGEGRDHDFDPDHCVADGEILSGEDWQLESIWTPGHMGCHLCFASSRHDAIFCGDIILGWSTTIISPPDGDYCALMASLQKLEARPETVFFPGHGDAILEPRATVTHHIAHRLRRHRQIRDVLADRDASARDIARCIYVDLPSSLLGAATRNVLAHLVDMHRLGEVIAAPSLAASATFSTVPTS